MNFRIYCNYLIFNKKKRILQTENFSSEYQFKLYVWDLNFQEVFPNISNLKQYYANYLERNKNKYLNNTGLNIRVKMNP